jgi:aspartate/methionine/tyrosine aminotransferase
MLCRLHANRDLCLAALESMPGVTVPVPQGAFYLFPHVDAAADSFAFCKELLLETKVGLAPGVAFGAGGEGSVRLCYASRPQTLTEALARMMDYLELLSSRNPGG